MENVERGVLVLTDMPIPYQTIVERYQRQRMYFEDLKAARELETKLRPIVRAVRRERAEYNHLALKFPVFWECYERQCAIAYRRTVV